MCLRDIPMGERLGENFIYLGDNLDVLRRYIKDESVDLVYIDPPFNTGKVQAPIRVTTVRDRNGDRVGTSTKNTSGTMNRLLAGIDRHTQEGS